MAELVKHLDTYAKAAPDALVFTSETGRPMWRGNFNKIASWQEAVAAIGAVGLHFHDLRHTGNTLASKTGTSLKDLMARMGHDSPRAALIYQHATFEADQAIAEAMNALLPQPEDDGDGDAYQGDDGDGSAVPVPA